MNKWTVINDATMLTLSNAAPVIPTRTSSGDIASSDGYSENSSTKIIESLAFVVAAIKNEKLAVSGNLFGKLERMTLELVDSLAYSSYTRNV